MDICCRLADTRGHPFALGATLLNFHASLFAPPRLAELRAAGARSSAHPGTAGTDTLPAQHAAADRQSAYERVENRLVHATLWMDRSLRLPVQVAGAILSVPTALAAAALGLCFGNLGANRTASGQAAAGLAVAMGVNFLRFAARLVLEGLHVGLCLLGGLGLSCAAALGEWLHPQAPGAAPDVAGVAAHAAKVSPIPSRGPWTLNGANCRPFTAAQHAFLADLLPPGPQDPTRVERPEEDEPADATAQATRSSLAFVEASFLAGLDDAAAAAAAPRASRTPTPSPTGRPNIFDVDLYQGELASGPWLNVQSELHTSQRTIHQVSMTFARHDQTWLAQANLWPYMVGERVYTNGEVRLAGHLPTAPALAALTADPHGWTHLPRGTGGQIPERWTRSAPHGGAPGTLAIRFVSGADGQPQTLVTAKAAPASSLLRLVAALPTTATPRAAA